MLEGDAIYREYILDHYKNPRNFGTLENPDISHKEFNPLCGDEIEIHVTVQPDKTTNQVRFSGQGCAISMAAASLLTEHIKNKPLHELQSLPKEVVLDMLAIPISATRMKCALISLDALRNGIKIYNTSPPKESDSHAVSQN